MWKTRWIIWYYKHINVEIAQNNCGIRGCCYNDEPILYFQWLGKRGGMRKYKNIYMYNFFDVRIKVVAIYFDLVCNIVSYENCIVVISHYMQQLSKTCIWLYFVVSKRDVSPSLVPWMHAMWDICNDHVKHLDNVGITY
jgi:hypothetical protein